MCGTGEMRLRIAAVSIVVLGMLCSLPGDLSAQATVADYERAFALQQRFEHLALNMPGPPAWIAGTSRFWYRKTVEDGHVFTLVDAATAQKRDAFNHAALAEALASASDRKILPRQLPFERVTFVDKETAVELRAFGHEWRCRLAPYACTDMGPIPPPPPPATTAPPSPTGIGHRGPPPQATSPRAKPSPDGRWEAFIRDYDVHVRSTKGEEATRLSWDGGEGDYYTFESLSWSPDSRKLAAYRLSPGQRRVLHYVEAAPEHQLQAKYSTLVYTKPGDVLDQQRPVLFHIDSRTRVDIDDALFRNQYDVSDLVWRDDGRAFTFEHNERGHEVYRVIEVDAATGNARTIITEESATFFFYRGRYRGKHFRHDIDDGKEIVWMSERDGWNHLYLYDGRTGQVKNQITRGEWVVRDVDRVDEQARQIWFHASGVYPEQNPYFVHYFRVNFDGTGMTPLTRENASHTVVFSPDLRYYVATRSRVDLPPVMELYSASDQRLLLRLEETDITALRKAGWSAPESFVAKGRDGTTDIWGVIYRPVNFDAERRYPVIEQIYAGPQNASVPDTFRVYSAHRSLAELGFIVVQIDGMGTIHRSKAFQDVAYKNLHDAGFPDRILWHRAVAARYPHYDLSRVGIYGGSAGGYASTAGILHHPDFYHVAVSANGNHDHRMDKISFNELFMGWPVGPEYERSSNVTNAWRLQGKLLLFLGEMDENVDPSSTLQLVNALIRANKTFDLVVVPGGGHGVGGYYVDRTRYDYFVRHLLGVEPPNWNTVSHREMTAK
jgi:dipeptidyl aminopeptidase/acylaminoacyl peptidase